MKRWVAAMFGLALGAAIAVSATLGVTKPWSSHRAPQATQEPTSGPAFSEQDVRMLTQEQLGGHFPLGAKWVRCSTASYRAGNDLWVLSCTFYAEDKTTAVDTRWYTFNDGTGKIEQ